MLQLLRPLFQDFDTLLNVVHAVHVQILLWLMPVLPIHMHPAQKKKAPSALSREWRGAKSACQGTARLPPPRLLRMLLDTIRTPPCGPWAGDPGLDKHSRQPFIVGRTSDHTEPSLGSLLASCPGGLLL